MFRLYFAALFNSSSILLYYTYVWNRGYYVQLTMNQVLCVDMATVFLQRGKTPVFFGLFGRTEIVSYPLHPKISVVIAFREITLIKYILKYINVYTT